MRPQSLSLLVLLLLLASGARAADGGDLQRFHPRALPWGGAATGAAELLPQGGWAAGLTFNYAKNPLVEWGENERASSTVAHNLTVHATGEYGILDWLAIGAALPFVVYQAGDDTAGSLAAQAVGDLRLTPRARLLHLPKHGMALSVAATVTIPLGGADAFAGDRSVGVIPELAFSYRGRGVTLASELGVRVRSGADLGGTRTGIETLLRLGAALDLTERLEGLIEFNGGLATETLSEGLVGNPLEVLVGARVRVAAAWALTLGAGTGLLSAPGTPDIRAIAGIAWAPRP